MKGLDLLKNLVKEADVVVEVVDARDIPGTRLPDVERWSGTNRLIVAVNKKDLVDHTVQAPRKGIVITAKNAEENERKVLLNSILEKTNKRPVKALFIGYPNVGKSSLINMLAKRKAAKVSPVAGTTRNVQWVRISNDLMVTDYRGVYPKQKKDELARKGALNIEADAELYAHKFAKKILSSGRLMEWAEKKFDIDMGSVADGEELLSAIAERRKLRMKGGELNIEEAARILVRAMKEAPEM